MDNIADMVRFLNGSEKISFAEKNTKGIETYQWIEKTLVTFSYLLLKKRDRGLVKKYIQKITGYSRSQVTRLINPICEKRQSG